MSSDSDCDDVFTDDSKGSYYDPKSSPGPCEDGRNLVNRKKRRGIIEKKRRDRINNSLSELRRLVPAAFEKQGSAKLEKAEILQMTVDHLRGLHSRGCSDVLRPFVTTDYHSLGYRECASEVSRYLSGFEGLDAQDPLRMRLMSHLQCFSSRRDLTARSQEGPRHLPWFTVPTPRYYPSLSSRMSVDGSPSYGKSAPYRPWGASPTEMAC